jgi:drug/metabolite transporter (DMT)-like permease
MTLLRPSMAAAGGACMEARWRGRGFVDPRCTVPSVTGARDGRLRTALLTAAALAAFAANSLLCRAALGTAAIDAASFTTLRLLSGALVLALVARRRPVRPVPHAGAAVALLAYALLFSIAYLRIPAAVGALALFGAVQVTMVITAFAQGQRPATGELGGLLLATAGLAALSAPGLGRPDPLGLGLMVGAGVAWAAYTIVGRTRGDAVAANADSFRWAAAGALVAQVAAHALGRAHLTLVGALLATLSGALTSGLGYVAWYAALPGLRPAAAAAVQLLVPVLAALGGVILLGEVLGARLLACGVVVLGGIGIVLGSRRRPG